MENRAHALAAGLFALALGLALIAALWWFSQEREPVREVVLVAQDDISGLGPQSRVRFRGLAVGTVSEIRIDPQDSRNILVRVGVSQDLPLTRGTRASIGTIGVTGLAFVQLDDRGTDLTPLVGEDGAAPRIALDAGLVSQIGYRTLEAVEQFRTLSQRLSTVFDDQNVTRMRAILARVESAAEGMDHSFSEVSKTLEAVRRVFAADNVARLSATLQHLERSTAQAPAAMLELRALITRADQMASRLDQAAGAARDDLIDGSLPQLNELLGELTSTSRRLAHLIDEVEAAPQMLLIGRPTPEPGPGEAGFAPNSPGTQPTLVVE
ncbi:MAG TPA: MlaD family protein [Thauera sp.]|jgi:phospholipid/cholesterol/gamma-HCH transport system substrate-binding protein|nr:MlaD family protein [Thauera sp.]